VFLLLVVSLAAVVGCPKQEDFPAALDLVVPPTPSDFVITNVGTAYTFSWNTSDPTDVDHYVIYLLGGGFVPDEVWDEAPSSPYSYDNGVYLTNLHFAVSAISTQGVEGERAEAVAPGP
jgi:hypothetical protein